MTKANLLLVTKRSLFAAITLLVSRAEVANRSAAKNPAGTARADGGGDAAPC
jgi:hypothetical protein